ncbi:TPA: glycosyltransferase [Enterobacter roggenkampii]|nr:glycosyltransferase [Enterobacter roggenkampii]HCK7143491.1 glycosyltransferase [Enterobacter roggenkampii]HCK7158948.1 glycosyltransferase [Enterobacter roggenkampii]HCK7214690.1 glycosyltransferase [Enterobacter roggenkampii]HCK7228017.1 glycosyltransferase [Enterobacter roggenkampii]
MTSDKQSAGEYMYKLDSLGYTFNKKTNIWIRSGYEDIGYNDGDSAEERLAQIVRDASDISIFSSELRNKCINWQTLYHLSSQRGNVLRPFSHLLKGDVLEIGAGCGAITRFLGENGGNILALEGSQRRASIAASRTRDLDNVQVLVERFDCFDAGHKFDAITLIGVLEYATMFGEGERPDYDLLSQIKRLLKPEGVLIIAIENKLGLKYFAGAPEDHLNKPMYGIEGRYTKGEPKTYGYSEIEKLLHSAGFQGVDVFLPFPDYKLPSSIITSSGASAENFDAAALAAQSISSDPQLPEILNFSLQNTFPEVFRNGLGIDLSNSFILACSSSQINVCDESILAWHYSTQRKKEYSKETIFECDANKEITVNYNFFGTQTADTDFAEYVQFRHNNDCYYSGICLSQKFFNVLTRPGWQISEVVSLLKEWISYLVIFANQEGEFYENRDLNLDAAMQLPGHFLDAIPQNIILRSDTPILFDVEWKKKEGVELGYLLFRGLLLVINQTKILPLTSNIYINRREFITTCLNNIGLNITDEQLDRYTIQEAQYQNLVTGRDVNILKYWGQERLLSPLEAVLKTYSTLYYAFDDSDLNQEDTFQVELRPGNNIIKWPLNALNKDSKISQLRFDPVDKSCWFDIVSFTIKDSNEDLVWDFYNQESQATLVDILSLELLQDKNAYFSSSDDPRINVLNLPRSSFFIVEIEIVLFDKDDISVSFYENLKLLEDRKDLLMQKEELLKHKKELLEDSETTINNNLQLLNDTKNLLDITQSNMLSAQARINAIENSTSWTVTKPLRYFGRIKHKMLVSLPILKGIIIQHGLKKSIIKGTKVLKTHGIRGLVNALRMQKNILPIAVSPLSGNQIKGGITFSSKHGYELKTEAKGYCYIPPAKPEKLAQIINDLHVKPLFSIVVPVYNTPIGLLDELIDSIKNQWYGKWELVLVNDCSTDGLLISTLNNIEDDKIKVINLETNHRISGATNIGIENSHGEYIVFADHDDTLTPDCLYEMVLSINKSDPDFIYSDEDKISEDGLYVQPHFKPDWSPDTMMSTMYTCHASCVKKILLSQVGLLRSEFDGCQDWDFVLRVSEYTSKIYHIPKVLYHWRIIPQSIAADIAAKDYVLTASQQTRKDALDRRGRKGEVEAVEGFPGYFRINYIPENSPLVSIIIPTRDNQRVLKRCIDSIQSITQYKNYELIVVDNGTIDEESLPYLNEISSQENVNVIRHDYPFNFSELNNIGVQQSRGDVLLFLNDDTEVIKPDWLERMIGFAQLPHVGAVGAKLLYPNTLAVQHAGVVNLADGPGHAFLNNNRSNPGYFMRNILDYNWLAVTGACLMMEKRKFLEVGQFDESFPIAYNDIELCFRNYEAGYYNVVCNAVELLHHESVSRGVDHIDPQKALRLSKEKKRLYEKHPQYYQYDPFFNVNLHPNGINFEVPF